MHTHAMKKKIGLYVVCLAVILSSATCSTPVLDSNGDEVRAGVEYKIYLTLSPGRVDLALTLHPTGNNLCPLDVLLADFSECLFQACGLPLTFHPEKGHLLTLSGDVNIKFNVTTTCKESTVWQVVSHDSVDTGFVSTGGVLGNQLSASWFRVEAVAPRVYQLKYCPRNFATFVCSNIGFAGKFQPLSVLKGKEGEHPFYFTIGKPTPTLSSIV